MGQEHPRSEGQYLIFYKIINKHMFKTNQYSLLQWHKLKWSLTIISFIKELHLKSSLFGMNNLSFIVHTCQVIVPASSSQQNVFNSSLLDLLYHQQALQTDTTAVMSKLSDLQTQCKMIIS